MLSAIAAMAGSNKPAAVLLAAFLAVTIYVGFLKVDLRIVRADLRAAQSELAAIEAGRAALVSQAKAQGAAYTATLANINSRRPAALEALNATSAVPVSDRDLDVLNCLRAVRAGRDCSAAAR